MILEYVTNGKIVVAHREGDRLGVRIRMGQTYSVTLYDGQRLVRTITDKSLSEAVMIVNNFIRKIKDYE